MECEEFLGARVNLQCWVKIKDDWRDNDFLLNNFGFQKISAGPGRRNKSAAFPVFGQHFRLYARYNGE